MFLMFCLLEWRFSETVCSITEMSSPQEVEERKVYISNLIEIQRRFIDLSETLRWELHNIAILVEKTALSMT